MILPSRKRNGSRNSRRRKTMATKRTVTREYKNINSSLGAEESGMFGPFRTPQCYNIVNESRANLNPSIAANTTRPGIAKASAPIRSPMNGGAVVKY
jgi:hypothetical protein